MVSDTKPSSVGSDGRPSSLGTDTQLSATGSEGQHFSVGSDRQPPSVQFQSFQEDEDCEELEKGVHIAQLRDYSFCLERRANLEKKFGGDIQVKLTQADSFKKIQFLEQIFDEFDEDKNGQMDLKEFFVALHTCGFRVSMPAALSILNEVDADNNGTIDIDEFVEFFKKMDDLETFRLKVETAQHASGTRGALLSVYVFVLLVGCFGLILLDIESNGENFVVRILLILLVLVFLASISAVVLVPLFNMKFKPDERMASLRQRFHESVMKSLNKTGTPKHVQETVVEEVEIPAPAPKAVEASRLKHPHLYYLKQPGAVEEASTAASRSGSSQSMRSYRKAARSEASIHSHRSNSAASGDMRMTPLGLVQDLHDDVELQVDLVTAFEKKVWEAPGAPDVGLTGLVDQEQGRCRSGYHVSQYDKARELQDQKFQAANQFQVSQAGTKKIANFTPFTQSLHAPRK